MPHHLVRVACAVHRSRVRVKGSRARRSRKQSVDLPFLSYLHFDMTQLRLTAPMRRQHILDCALPIFGEHGFHDTSMNDIANAAGITKPVIYQHFASKRDLYSALITELGEEMIATVTQATGDASDGKAQTQQGFHAYFTWVDQHQDGFRVLFGGAAQRDNEFASHLGKSDQRLRMQWRR